MHKSLFMGLIISGSLIMIFKSRDKPLSFTTHVFKCILIQQNLLSTMCLASVPYTLVIVFFSLIVKIITCALENLACMHTHVCFCLKKERGSMRKFSCLLCSAYRMDLSQQWENSNCKNFCGALKKFAKQVYWLNAKVMECWFIPFDL